MFSVSGGAGEGFTSEFPAYFAGLIPCPFVDVVVVVVVVEHCGCGCQCVGKMSPMWVSWRQCGAT